MGSHLPTPRSLILKGKKHGEADQQLKEVKLQKAT